MSRTATFVFLIDERFYGVITAYVAGPDAAGYALHELAARAGAEGPRAGALADLRGAAGRRAGRGTVVQAALCAARSEPKANGVTTVALRAARLRCARVLGRPPIGTHFARRASRSAERRILPASSRSGSRRPLEAARDLVLHEALGEPRAQLAPR